MGSVRFYGKRLFPGKDFERGQARLRLWRVATMGVGESGVGNGELTVGVPPSTLSVQ